jgi:hypothetical protein
LVWLYVASLSVYWLSSRIRLIACTRLGADAGSAQADSITGATFARTGAGVRGVLMLCSSTA